MKIEELYQIWMESDDDFFKRIDECGGWPTGMKYVTYQHTFESKRPCYFGNENRRDEWNTTFHSADDYYLWKLSEEAKNEIRRKERLRIAQNISYNITR